jgi:hypothetical protein
MPTAGPVGTHSGRNADGLVEFVGQVDQADDVRIELEPDCLTFRSRVIRTA